MIMQGCFKDGLDAIPHVVEFMRMNANADSQRYAGDVDRDACGNNRRSWRDVFATVGEPAAAALLNVLNQRLYIDRWRQ